jgi:hypothetical protein
VLAHWHIGTTSHHQQRLCYLCLAVQNMAVGILGYHYPFISFVFEGKKAESFCDCWTGQ